jgi:dethiobiotin synthetase
MITRFTRIPVLGQLPYLSDPTDRAALSQAAANLDLEAFLPLRFPIAV